MRAYRNGKICDTNEAELLFTEPRSPMHDDWGYLGETEETYYATPDKRFFYVVTNWFPRHSLWPWAKPKFESPQTTLIERSLDDICYVMSNASEIQKKHFEEKYL